MNRRYYAIYRRPSRSGRRTEPPKNKKKRKFYEDNKYKKGPGYYEDKKPGPARKKHIDLGMFYKGSTYSFQDRWNFPYNVILLQMYIVHVYNEGLQVIISKKKLLYFFF